MTNISGVPSSPSSPTPPSSGISPMTGDPMVAPVGSPGMKPIMDTKDTISPNIIQPAQSAIGTYDAKTQTPILPPPDPDGATGPQPYGMPEKKMINQAFSKKLGEQIKKLHLPPDLEKQVFADIQSGNIGKLPPEAKEAYDKALDDTRKEARLPDSWTPHSSSRKDWIPAPVQPYGAAKQTEINAHYEKELGKALQQFIDQSKPPLTDEQIKSLTTALATGKVGPQDAENVIAVTKMATEETQKVFGLPNTWVKGTTNLEDWKPVNIGLITPASVNNAQALFLLGNIENMAAEVDKVVANLVASLPANDPNLIAAKDFRSIIAAAIRQLKDMQREIQVKDANKSTEVSKVKITDIQARQANLDEQIKKGAEQRQKALMMKIFGPIITLIVAIISVVLALFSGGASMSLLVAIIVIQVVLLTYSIIDSATGATQKIMDAFNSWLDKTFPGNEAAKAGIKALIACIVIVILIIVIVFSGGGAAASIATATAAQTAVAVAKEIIKQLCYQMIIMVIMTSNAIPELFGAMLKACGVKDTKIGEIIMMVITMIVAIVATAKGGGGGAGALGKVAGGVEKGAEAAAKAAADTAKQINRTFEQVLAAAIQKLKDLPKEVVAGIKKSLTEALEGLKSIAKGAANLREVLGGLSDMSKAKDAIKAAAGDATKIAEGAEKLAKAKETIAVAGRNVSESASKALKITSAVIQTGEGIARGVIGIQIYKIKMQVGDLKEAEALLQAIIDLLQKLLDNIDLGIQGSSELLTSANNFLNKFTAGWEESDKKIFGSRSM